ncbi:MAG: hypothetical protein R3B70_42010 [Polyangiaceae bacterium]
MPGFETPSPNDPQLPPTQGPFTWTHYESDPEIIGPAALRTAKLDAWDKLDPVLRARHLRAFTVMSLQAATLRSEPQQLGVLSARSYIDDEHNAAGAAVARTLMLIAPRGPMLIAQNVTTAGGQPPVFGSSSDTGVAPVLVALAIVAAVAVVGAVGYVIGSHTSETADRQDFREAKTKQLLSTQATAIEVLAKHAEREKIAGKPLPFTDEEKAILRSLEETQRAITTERREPMPAPFDGAKLFADLGAAATGFMESLLPIVLVGGALYLVHRFGGAFESRASPVSAPASPETITLTRNKDGVYEHEEGHSQD